MTEPADVRVLHRDADLLVLFKPAGLPTTSPDGRGCLTEIAARIDPHAPRLHASSRLDAEVTGVVTFARTTRAIEALLAARRAGQYERYYLGLAIGAPSPAQGEFNWPIERDPRDPRKRAAGERAADSGAARDSGVVPHSARERSGRSRDSHERISRENSQGSRERDESRGSREHDGRRAVDSGMHRVSRADKLQAQDALTRYRVLGSLPTAALLLLSPMTGRTHQLRVHVARAGVPLLGDRHYGGPVRCTLPDGRVVRAGRVMLHCARVRLPQIGGGGERLTVDAPVPEDFRQVWLALGGEISTLETALVGV